MGLSISEENLPLFFPGPDSGATRMLPCYPGFSTRPTNKRLPVWPSRMRS